MRGGGAANRVFVSPHNTYQSLFECMRVKHKEGINGIYRICRPELAVPPEGCFDLTTKAPRGSLQPAPLRCDSLVNKVTDL